MLISDLHVIGNKLLSYRKRLGLTQAEVAERAGMSDRTYADIERGTVNMRIETMLSICQVLHVTPDEVFVEEDVSENKKEEELLARLHNCNSKDRETVFKLISVYLKSLE